MLPNPDSEYYEFWLPDSRFGLSIRRLVETLRMGQPNPFGRSPIGLQSTLALAPFVDLCEFTPISTIALTGFTLDQVWAWDDSDLPVIPDKGMRESIRAPGTYWYLEAAFAIIREIPMVRAARGFSEPFLPQHTSGDEFAVPVLRSKVRNLLRKASRETASAVEWLGRVENWPSKGVRAEELHFSGLKKKIHHMRPQQKLDGATLSSRVSFETLRLSVIPNIKAASTQVRFRKPTNLRVARIKGAPKPQVGQQRELHLVDPVMGYRIEKVLHPALWGNDINWQLIAFDGSVVKSTRTRRVVFATPSEAAVEAQRHAQRVLPKMIDAQQWLGYAWPGGKDYREWLFTLPWFPAIAVSDHFTHRNVLFHVRSDWRDGPNDERILLVHELQSDWLQLLRREDLLTKLERPGSDPTDLNRYVPPFIKEWPELALKLLILHAAFHRADALAWTTGKQQLARWGPHATRKLKDFYDHTLPGLADKLGKEFGFSCEPLEVYVAQNFAFRRNDQGYEVTSAEGEFLGQAPTIEEAKGLLPESAHEQLFEVHGITLDEANRTAIRERGFSVWG